MLAEFGATVGSISWTLFIGRQTLENNLNFIHRYSLKVVIHVREYTMDENLVLTVDQYSIINGSLLGDGSIAVQKSGSCGFAKNQAVRRREYLDWHMKELHPFSSSVNDSWNWAEGKRYRRSRFITHVHELFKGFRNKWYPEGKKIVPKDLQLTPLSLAIWYVDDGYNCSPDGIISLHTESFDDEGKEHLVKELAKLNINAYVYRRVIKIKVSSYHDFIDLVSPYVLWNCYQYKIDTSNYNPQFHCLTEDKVKEILKLYDEKTSQKELSEKFDVSITTVSDILRGKRFRSITKDRSSRKVALNCVSGVKGVCWDKGRQQWMASIRKDKKNKFLGRFDVLEDAVDARKKAELSN
jgi:hypothetical protein